jgi:hypothetical protein
MAESKYEAEKLSDNEYKLPDDLLGVPIEKIQVLLANGDIVTIDNMEILITPSGQKIGCIKEEGDIWKKEHASTYQLAQKTKGLLFNVENILSPLREEDWNKVIQEHEKTRNFLRDNMNAPLQVPSVVNYTPPYTPHASPPVLREVEVTPQANREPYKALFHGFFQGDPDNGEVLAMIESEYGSVATVDHSRIRFTDRKKHESAS